MRNNWIAMLILFFTYGILVCCCVCCCAIPQVVKMGADMEEEVRRHAEEAARQTGN